MDLITFKKIPFKVFNCALHKIILNTIKERLKENLIIQTMGQVSFNLSFVITCDALILDF